MKTLHIAPGYSAGGTLIKAIREAGRSDEVLRFPDDLSCGPIASDDPSARAAWWAQGDEGEAFEDELRTFWDQAMSSESRLVVWFGRHSASELAFFLAWADKLAERPYDIVDVTGRALPFRQRDGSADAPPATRVAIVQHEALQSLFGHERPIMAEEWMESRRHWQRLRAENAPFRIVTEAGLASAPLDYFDPWILRQVTTELRSVARVVGVTMGENCEPYDQIGSGMLHERVIALIGESKLLAEGNPCDMRSCHVRLPD
jgi:hypothetical protein